MGSQNFHPVTHVVFDLDGLLLDTETKYEISINNICERYGKKYTLEARLEALGRVARDAAAAVVKHCDLPIGVDQFLTEIEVEYVKVFQNVGFMPGAERLIRHLSKNNIPIAIATSGKLSNFKRKTLDHGEIFRLFHHIVFGSEDKEVKRGKPAPDIFVVAASRFLVRPKTMQHVLVFEDATAGVQGALAAGMQVVWVPDHCIDTTKQEKTLLLKSLEQFQPELFGLPKFEDKLTLED